MPKLAAIGECMIELSRDAGRSSSDYRMGYGGDSLNVALYCARWGGQVDYVTVIGDDGFSRNMRADWALENIGVGLVQKMPNRQSGLYIIETDGRGERSFTYWRDNAPAREMFDGKDCAALLQDLRDFSHIYFSGITLSLFSKSALEVFMDLLVAYKRGGGTLIFDLNYRPARWESAEKARGIIAPFLPLIDIALPSQDDEDLLYGKSTPELIIERYRKLGVSEIVVKCGVKGCVLWHEGETKQIAANIIETPVDTTAAGDGFNGGYLAARLSGKSPVQAVGYGQKTASLVIGYPGAIVPRQNWPADYKISPASQGGLRA